MANYHCYFHVCDRFPSLMHTDHTGDTIQQPQAPPTVQPPVGVHTQLSDDKDEQLSQGVSNHPNYNLIGTVNSDIIIDKLYNVRASLCI